MQVPLIVALVPPVAAACVLTRVAVTAAFDRFVTPIVLRRCRTDLAVVGVEVSHLSDAELVTYLNDQGRCRR